MDRGSPFFNLTNPPSLLFKPPAFVLSSRPPTHPPTYLPTREWPTIPQLFVDGEFVGGCDILTSLFQSGELAQLLEESAKKEKAN